ncbi:AGAP001268-PA-like protein [Anopheles sinensis]|uniref:AGAP001268-PA-like protein n=1 Tax=Anopheles sinensis TaxID=74873 RepID=A0A084W0L3_ANOSI|nr:AGAP001268-PA-like protein [Anopheles sinensis]
MAGPVDTRKRSREEEQNEFMPLSKRINNLHLNTSQHSIGGVLQEQLGPTVAPHGQYAAGQQQHEYASHQNHHLFGGGSDGHSSHLGVTAGSSSSSSNGSLSIPANSASNSPASTHTTISINGEILGDYCPVLTAEENPHYFTKNKVLYELYVERMRRLQ